MASELALLFLLFVACVPSSAVVVDTEYGQVRGHLISAFNGRDTPRDIVSFLGVPFAQDTSGANRFQKPVRPEPWGMFEADTLGYVCPQGSIGLITLTHPGWTKIGEDCLNINIYTPTDMAGGPYPVMFWIHGGGFSTGANIQYPGHFMATYDVIVVTVNYRLNKFGFAYTGNDACPGNFGLWDQKMALDFVRTNIGNFGGDINRITVFGESAGAVSASHFMLSPQTRDLFSSAIMESGAETCGWSYVPPEAEPETYILQVADNLGCTGDDVYETMDCMRYNVTWEDIYRTGYSCPGNGYGCGMSPVIDGEDGFLPMSPWELRKNGPIMSGPIISGINMDEGALGLGENCCERSTLENTWRGSCLASGPRTNASTKEDCYNAWEYQYSPWPYLDDKGDNRRRYIDFGTDSSFGACWDQQLKDHSQVAPTFGYVYNYRGRKISKFLPESFGVCHGMELPQVWGLTLLLLPENQGVKNDSEIRMDNFEWTDEDIQHTVFFMEMFAHFAKHGNPSPTPVPNPTPVGGSTTWQEYTLQDFNVLIISNTSIEIDSGFRQSDFATWNQYMPLVTEGVISPKAAGVDTSSYEAMMSFLEKMTT